MFPGTSDESLRLGPAPAREMALQIARSAGPSGPNSQYLLNLAKFMREEVSQHEDQHLFELEALVKNFLETNSEDVPS